MVSFKDSLLAFLMRKSLVERYDFERSFKEEGIILCSTPVNSNKHVYVKCPLHPYNESQRQRIADFTAGHESCNMPTYENSLASRRDILKTVVNIDEFAKEYPKFYKKYGFNPSKISLHSHMKLSFYCKYCNAIHYKSVAERVTQVYGCSQYNAIYQTSIPYGTDKRSRYELDIFSPSVNFCNRVRWWMA